MNARELLRRGLRACGLEVLRYAPGKRRLYYGERMLLSRQGELTLEESRFLGELVRGLQTPGPIVEVGSLFGSSTRILALFASVGRSIVAVDNFTWNPLGISPAEHFLATRLALDEAIQKYGLQLLRIDKNEFYRTYEGPRPSLVFVDAGHSYEETRKDIVWARGAGAELVCGHDYNERDWPGVVHAVKEFGGPRRLVGTLWAL